MKSIRIASDIIPLGEFKTGLSACLKKVQATGHPLIITQNGRPAGAVRFSEAEKTRFTALWNEAKPVVMFKDRNGDV